MKNWASYIAAVLCSKYAISHSTWTSIYFPFDMSWRHSHTHKHTHKDCTKFTQIGKQYNNLVHVCIQISQAALIMSSTPFLPCSTERREYRALLIIHENTLSFIATYAFNCFYLCILYWIFDLRTFSHIHIHTYTWVYVFHTKKRNWYPQNFLDVRFKRLEMKTPRANVA